MNTTKHKFKTGIYITLIVLFLSNLNLLPIFVSAPRTVFNTDLMQNNRLIKKINQLKEIKRYIKREEKVGFISDTKINKVFDETFSVYNFHALQLAIAPVIAENTTETKYVIGIFKTNKVLIPKELELYKDLNNGIIIFKNRSIK